MAWQSVTVWCTSTPPDEEQNAAKSVEELSMKRIRKDSFYWYSKLIRSNGQDWGKEMLK